ncbi:hypothetical protein [Burkholderia sp. BE17]|uniref:hypothetical protein n=1 Tax=Burkholderia sp. BE17 TaxID=2656644 RepID=UPI00187B3808|nr:hypothetical protein [Burkholderia sp. BE17]
MPGGIGAVDRAQARTAIAGPADPAADRTALYCETETGHALRVPVTFVLHRLWTCR